MSNCIKDDKLDSSYCQDIVNGKIKPNSAL